MKILKVIAVIFSLTLLSFTNGNDSIYDINFKDIEGNKVDMNNYRNKKILLTVIPVDEKDSGYAKQLINFYNLHKNEISIIGIVSEEAGYKQEKKNTVKSLLPKNVMPNIILTESMYTQKGSGNKQSKLLKWLTGKENNRHFDQDVKGVGQKFFVDESGNLYAVIGPELGLDANLIKNILSKSPKKYR